MGLEDRVAALEAHYLQLRSALPAIMQHLASADMSAAGAGLSIATRDYDKASARMDKLSEHHQEIAKIITELLNDE